MDKTTIISY